MKSKITEEMSDLISWEEFQGIIAEMKAVDKEKISKETNIIEKFEFDSLDIMTLLDIIEEKWGVDYSDLEDFAGRLSRCDLIWEGINYLLHIKEEEK